MLERLWPLDPWTHSYEGLDNHCLFCLSGHHRYEEPYQHYPDCPWMQAADFLGRDHSNHASFVPPDNPHREECRWCGWETTAASHEKMHDEWYPHDPPSGPRFPPSDSSSSLGRHLADVLPPMHPSRGFITFAPPPEIP